MSLPGTELWPGAVWLRGGSATPPPPCDAPAAPTPSRNRRGLPPRLLPRPLRSSSPLPLLSSLPNSASVIAGVQVLAVKLVAVRLVALAGDMGDKGPDVSTTEVPPLRGSVGGLLPPEDVMVKRGPMRAGAAVNEFW